ncbi:tyrosine-type recombinase/integrase [Stigmatella aurantiaca]|nr:site-specific integrase [Stigmatella aurantiaca]
MTRKTKAKPKPRKGDPRQEELPITETPTLEALFEWYEKERLCHQKRNTRDAYKTSFRAALKRFGKHGKPSKGQVQGWLSERVRKAEILPSTANVVRAHLHRVYALARDLRWPLLLNVAAFPCFPDVPKKPEGLRDTYRTWPMLLACMPDARARAFLSFQRWEGLRVSEVLGLEWKHVKWDAEGGPQVIVEQQRSARRTVPGTLKNDAAPAAFPLSDETVRLLRELRRDFMAARPMLGAVRSGLAGRRPCRDGAVRSYVFPYFMAHVLIIGRRLGLTAPEEFPEGIRGLRAPKRFHRLRHTFGTETVNTVGVEVAKGLLRHKFINTTVLYADAVRGRVLDKDALKKVRREAQARQAQAVEEASGAISLSGKANGTGGVSEAVKPRSYGEGYSGRSRTTRWRFQ